MRGRARDRRLGGRFGLAPIGLAALGGALVLTRQAAYGASVTFDSIDTLAVAERLPEGREFRNYEGNAYAQSPPLYSLLLAAAALGVFEPIRVAGLPNSALFAATPLRRSSGSSAPRRDSSPPDAAVSRPDGSSFPPVHRSGIPNGSRCVGAVERNPPECLGTAFAA